RSRHHFSIYLTDHGFLSGGSLEGRQWVDFQALAKLTSSHRRQLLTARRACRPKAAVASSNRTAPSTGARWRRPSATGAAALLRRPSAELSGSPACLQRSRNQFPNPAARTAYRAKSPRTFLSRKGLRR